MITPEEIAGAYVIAMFACLAWGAFAVWVLR